MSCQTCKTEQDNFQEPTNAQRNMKGSGTISFNCLLKKRTQIFSRQIGCGIVQSLVVSTLSCLSGRPFSNFHLTAYSGRFLDGKVGQIHQSPNVFAPFWGAKVGHRRQRMRLSSISLEQIRLGIKKYVSGITIKSPLEANHSTLLVIQISDLAVQLVKVSRNSDQK